MKNTKITLETMSKTEKSLLLFFEECAVNHSGKVTCEQMNDADYAIAKRWNQADFISFGRVVAKDCDKYGTNWCKLSPEAWAIVSVERKARAERTWANRLWRTTNEKRSGK